MSVSGISPSKMAWIRFRRNPLSVSGLVIIGLAILMAVFAYLLSPDKVKHANSQVLEIALEKPGFRCDFLLVRQNKEIHKESFFRQMFTGREAYLTQIPISEYRFENDKIIVLEYSKYKDDNFYSEYLLADICFPVDQSSYEYRNDQTHFLDIDKKEIVQYTIDVLREIVEEECIVKSKFRLGTDRFGRDMLSRMIIGTRISLSVGFIAVFISLLVGIILGGIAGYFRGWVDKVIMWFVNVVWSIPTLLMVISITLVLGKGYWQVFVAVGLTMWVEVARVVRGQVLSVREKEYVEAARVMGMGPGRILFRHIIPNVISPVIIISAANFATAILMEAGLSFLGIGVQPPIPSWGAMIKEHYGYIIVELGYLAFIPGFAIMLMVLAFTLAGNGLRDAMDSRTVTD